MKRTTGLKRPCGCGRLRKRSEEAPNLTILPSNIRFFPPVPEAGEPVTITAVIRNQGKLAAENVIVLFEGRH